MLELGSDIFISYSREDRDFAGVLAERFRSRGWSVWWDHQMLPGEDFTSRLQNQLDAARCVVVVWSAHSVSSKYVRDEASEGLQGNRLVPVRIDDVRPPIGFRNVHTADLIDWRSSSTSNEFAMLDEAIMRLVSGGAERSLAKHQASSVSTRNAAPEPDRVASLLSHHLDWSVLDAGASAADRSKLSRELHRSGRVFPG